MLWYVTLPVELEKMKEIRNVVGGYSPQTLYFIHLTYKE